MTAETLKLFRINLLRQARGAKGLGLSVNELALGAKTEGHNVNTDDVNDELQYLIDKKQIEVVPADISPEVKSYRITATGRDWLATQAI
jgi:hypothetical protein